MSELSLARLFVGLLALFGAGMGLFLFWQGSAELVKRLPRAKVLGYVLSTLCWSWVAWELIVHPIDMIPFSSRTILIIALLGVPLTWTLLSNLLCARALGGLMMLWPMPVFLVVREQVTLWRLVPVVAGYVSLIAGMITVFYPWTFRVVCDKVAANVKVRYGFAGGFVLLAGLAGITLVMLGKVVGE